MIVPVSAFALLLAGRQGAPLPALNIPDGSTLLMTARVEGVYVYDSVADPQSPTGLNWIARGPEGILYDSAHHRIGRLTKGPSFILDDATNISTDIHHFQSLPSPDPGSMSWTSWPVSISSMLGPFTGVTTVMRIETAGGESPKDKPTPDHRTDKEPFQATYVFLGTDLRDPNAKYQAIMSTPLGSVDWGNITVSEALTSATFFPGIPFYASPDLTARINLKAKGLTFAQALHAIADQAHAEVFVRNGKVYAFPRG